MPPATTGASLQRRENAAASTNVENESVSGVLCFVAANAPSTRRASRSGSGSCARGTRLRPWPPGAVRRVAGRSGLGESRLPGPVPVRGHRAPLRRRLRHWGGRDQTHSPTLGSPHTPQGCPGRLRPLGLAPWGRWGPAQPCRLPSLCSAPPPSQALALARVGRPPPRREEPRERSPESPVSSRRGRRGRRWPCVNHAA